MTPEPMPAADPPALNAAGRSFAASLADACLGGDWTRAGLLDRATDLCGRRPRWLGPVVTSVLRGYPAAPRDRPRELAGYIADLDRFRWEVGAARRRGRPIRAVGDRPVRPTTVVRSRWDAPPIDDLAALARLLDLTETELDWYADRRSLNRRAATDRLRHYRYTWLRGRLIEAPKPALRARQRRLLAEVFGPIPVHGCAHGFVPGRSGHTFAAPHTGQATVLRVDLVSFFASITAARVYGLLRTAGHPEPVAHALAALCTTRTPGAVLRAAPATLPDRAYRTALLRGAHLPQGAPTSPALANLCGYRLDRRLAGLADAFDARYTRYADDLAFSGDFGPVRARALVAQVDAIAADEGFRVHPAKTRIRGRGDRQYLAGLVVNHRPAAPRPEYDRLRAILYDAARHGFEAANRCGRPNFAEYLAGRVSWVGQHHPTRAAKLARLLDNARLLETARLLDPGHRAAIDPGTPPQP
jgi:RNA-directed DNA polymerase